MDGVGTIKPYVKVLDYPGERLVTEADPGVNAELIIEVGLSTLTPTPTPSPFSSPTPTLTPWPTPPSGLNLIVSDGLMVTGSLREDQPATFDVELKNLWPETVNIQQVVIRLSNNNEVQDVLAGMTPVSIAEDGTLRLRETIERFTIGAGLYAAEIWCQDSNASWKQITASLPGSEWQITFTVLPAPTPTPTPTSSPTGTHTPTATPLPPGAASDLKVTGTKLLLDGQEVQQGACLQDSAAYTLRITVANIGNAPASAFDSVGILFGDSNDLSLGGLAPGEEYIWEVHSTPFVATCNLPYGVAIDIDSSKTVPESDESNNHYAKALLPGCCPNATASLTPTKTSSATFTSPPPTDSPTPTHTSTTILTFTQTSTPALSPTPTPSSTPTHTATFTNLPSTPTSTATSTATPSHTRTRTATFTPIDSNAVRNLPDSYAPGLAFTVTIAVSPNSQTIAWSVEESPPSGWTVSTISAGGNWDSINRKVKWGPFFEATSRALSYEASSPGDASDEAVFAGVYSADGESEAIGGDTLVRPLFSHPADTNYDWRIDINQMTAYAAAWKRGDTWPTPPNPIPVDYVTNAALLWKTGEVYHYDSSNTPPLCWISGSGDSTRGEPDRVMSKSAEAEKGAGSSVIRSFSPEFYTPGEPVVVTVSVTPDISVVAWAIEEIPPDGWLIGEINEGGAWDAVNKKVKWGPFFDSTPRSLVYEATPPAAETGQKAFSGQASFDGAGVAVEGEATIHDGATTIRAWDLY